MKHHLLTVTIILLLALFSCSSSPKENNTVTSTASVAKTIIAKDNFEKGKVLSHITCNSNQSESFAMYVPSTYDTSKKNAAIIFFDPHAGGEFVIKKYQHLAEEFSTIIIASENSKNGLSSNETNEIANTLIAETTNRFAVDDRITLAGFSGGAKVALASGAANSFVASVIYCGAVTSVASKNISLLGFAGVDDMNYTDLLIFDQSEQNAVSKHFLIEWNGKHEWVDSTNFRDAFYWVTFNRMREHQTKVDTGIINKFIVDSEKKLSKTHDVLQQSAIQQKIIFMLDGLFDVSKYVDANTKLQQTEIFQNALKAKQQSLQAETIKKQEYINAFQSKDLMWWKPEIEKLSKQKDPMSQRLMGFLSLAGFSISNNAIQQNNFAVAEKMLAIYKLADPKNSDQAFLEACLLAKQGKNQAAVQSLQRAVDLGLSDANKILTEPALQSLQSNDDFNKLVSKMRTKEKQNATN
jgi:dienelactone hydrolase